LYTIIGVGQLLLAAEVVPFADNLLGVEEVSVAWAVTRCAGTPFGELG